MFSLSTFLSPKPPKKAIVDATYHAFHLLLLELSHDKALKSIIANNMVNQQFLKSLLPLEPLLRDRFIIQKLCDKSHSYQLLSEKMTDFLYTRMSDFCFTPSIDTTIVPFRLKQTHVIYDLKILSEEQEERFETLMPKCLRACIMQDKAKRDELAFISEAKAWNLNTHILVFNWQHKCYIYNPFVKNPYYYLDDEIWKYAARHNITENTLESVTDLEGLPSFYPDGDYHFFLHFDEKSNAFDFGLLGHPWRRELLVFGKKLIQEMQKYEKIFGIVRK